MADGEAATSRREAGRGGGWGLPAEEAGPALGLPVACVCYHARFGKPGAIREDDGCCT